MTLESRHQYLTENHRLERFVYADATARAAGLHALPSGDSYTITSADIGQIAYQTDTGIYYRLVSTGPNVWVAVSPDLSAYLKKDGSVALTADWNVGSHKLTGLTDPSSAQHAATKAYVDAAVAAGGSSVICQIPVREWVVATGSFQQFQTQADNINFYLNAASNGDKINVEFMVPAGTYHLKTMRWKDSNMAQIAIQIDGSTVFTYDCYAASSAWFFVDHGTVTLTDGHHLMSIVVTGKNGSSSGYYFLTSGTMFTL